MHIARFIYRVVQKVRYQVFVSSILYQAFCIRHFASSFADVFMNLNVGQSKAGQI